MSEFAAAHGDAVAPDGAAHNWLTPVGAAAAPTNGKRALRLRFYTALFAGDVVALGAGFMIGRAIAAARGLPEDGYALLAAIPPIYLLLGIRTLHAETLERWRTAAWMTIVHLLAAFLLTIFVGFVLKEVAPVSRLSALITFVASAALLLLGRSTIGWWSDRAFRGSALNRLLILDGVAMPQFTGLTMEASEPIDTVATTFHPLALDRLARQLRGMDEVFVACAPERRARWATVLKGSGVASQLLMPELDSVGVIGHKQFAGIAAVMVSAGGLALRDRVLKRLLDIAIVVPAIVLLSPLLAIVALLVRLDSAGPALFVQPRVGRGNHLFAMFKFRSMRQAATDRDGAVSTTRGDARVTRIGRIIRATSIDELPQLFNILRGDMSLVGPRPHAIGSLAGDQLFWQVDQRHHHRHVSKPGLTGLAQVRGFRGATHRREDLVNRLDADLEYVNGWSLMRDLAILVATLKVMIHRNAF